MTLNSFEKYKIILEVLQNKKQLSAYDEILQEKLDLSPKQIDRLLSDLAFSVDGIVKLKENKKNIYKLIDNSALFLEAFKNSDDKGWIFQLIQDDSSDSKVMEKLKTYTKESSDIYLLKSALTENLKDLESKKTFQHAKRAIKNREYIKIVYSNQKVLDNQKALKLVFMDNNWYLAHISEDEKLRFSRMSLLKDITYATIPNSYQPSKVKKFEKFLKEGLQNSFSLEEKKPQRAKLKALPPISKYFEKDMKKFFPSQKFLAKNSDNSIEFEVSYTQELEILPFVQRWLPDMVIVEPKELKDAFLKKLESAVENNTGEWL